MKKILLTVLCVFFSVGYSAAENSVLTDNEILAGLLSDALQNIIEPHSRQLYENPKKNAYVSYPQGINLTPGTKMRVEEFLTRKGFSITPDAGTSDVIFTLSVADARIMLVGNKKGFDRTVQVNVHVKCVDSAKKILFAGGSRETSESSIPKKLVSPTNDSMKFSKNLKREIVRGRLDRMRIMSFFIISGVLAYFAAEGA